MTEPWWSGATLYQIYVRSWKDSNGDGIGDLQGVISGLDHLEWLGVDGIWLSPTMPSPNRDWGYDVSDYYGVHPELGTEADMARLIEEASWRGIRVLLDLVPNHTSDAHPWFVQARSDPSSPMRERYVWAKPGAGGGPPNNWRDATGASAWTLDEPSGQYYLHNFLPSQPDLDWWNGEVRAEFERILAYWFDRGVAGFRIDVAHGLVKDSQLRDDPEAGPEHHPMEVRSGLVPVYSANRPEVADIYRRWRRLADSYEPPRALLGETWVLSPEGMARFYGEEADQLQLCFNFGFLFADLSAGTMADLVRRTLASLPEGATPLWTGSNHDVSRFPTRWAAGDERRSRAALVMLCALPGTVVLYYGDEIGMTDVEMPEERLLDEMAVLAGRTSRDHFRSPMQWSDRPNGGFAEDGAPTWLPMGDCAALNVRAQRADPRSTLHLCRTLLMLRRRGLASSGYRPLVEGPDVWAWEGASRFVTAVNLSPRTAEVAGVTGTVVADTGDGGRRSVAERLVMEPWHAVVVEREG
ncbi:MAG: alpha-amylase family glycosyl hydrolase [Actinomycetota bacterium]|nr:alpha-amylase family glycosyl hydrolase [Actinomycetota bacterium]